MEEERDDLFKPKIKPQHETFLQIIANAEKSPTDAYQEVFPNSNRKTARNQAHKLLKSPLIRERMAEILQEIGKRSEVSENEVIFNLRKARDMAFAEGKYSDAIKATELLAKYIGFFDAHIEDGKKKNPFEQDNYFKNVQKITKFKVVENEG